VKKLKKHSGTQTETEPSIVEQVPDDKMELFVQMLNEMMERKRSGKPASPRKKG